MIGHLSPRCIHGGGRFTKKNIKFIDFVGFFFRFRPTIDRIHRFAKENDAFLSLLESGDFHDWPGLGQFWVFFSPLSVSSRGLTGEGSAMIA